jgi:hypothetical protein
MPASWASAKARRAGGGLLSKFPGWLKKWGSETEKEAEDVGGAAGDIPVE